MKVEPIRNKKDIKTIKKLLSHNKRDLFLFTLGINSGIRVDDLVKLKVYQLLNKEIGDTINIIEGKTKKHNFIIINKNIYKAFKQYYKKNKLKNDDYIFKSRKKGFHLDSNSVHRIIKQWCKSINLKGNYGNHTLRKTWAYHHYQNGTPLPQLMKRLNHFSPAITLRYICIKDEDIQNICMLGLPLQGEYDFSEEILRDSFNFRLPELMDLGMG